MEKTVVNQVKALDVEVDKISIDSIADSALTDNELLELADVVTAIENASNREIKTINHGFDSLKATLLASYHRAKKTEETRQPQSKNKVKEDLRQDTPKKIHENGQIAADKPSANTSINNDVTITEEKRRNLSTKMDDSRQVAGKAKSQKQRKPIEITEEHEEPRATIAQEVIGPIAQPTIEGPQSIAKTSENSPLIESDALANYRMDENGRLRNEKGAFASKVEQQQYDKAKAATEEGHKGEPEKQTSLLKQAVFSLGRLALIGADKGIGRNGLADKNSNIKTTAGVAVGGSYFLAAQEVATFLTEAKESLKESGITSFGDVVKKAKDSATGAIGKVAVAGSKAVAIAKAVKVKITGDDESPAKPKKSRAAKLKAWIKSKAEKKDSEKAQTKDTSKWSFSNALKKVKGSTSSAIDKVKSAGSKVAAIAKDAQLKAASDNSSLAIKSAPKAKESPVARLKAWFKAKADDKQSKAPPVVTPKANSQPKSAPSWLKSGTNPLFRFLAKVTPKPNRADLDSLAIQKNEAQAADQRHQETIIALGDIEDAIKGIKLDGGGSGIFGEALDFLGDRKKRKRGKGVSRGGRPSRVGGVDVPERSQRTGSARGSAYGSTGRAIPSVASSAGTAVKGSMGGAALKAGGAVLSKLALPLTVAMAAYDGISGYNDTEGQKETFKLKDDQEASFGQKAAMATGSILSLGGLTEMIGLSGSDISKGVYKAFGGQIEGEESPAITLATPITLLTDAISSLTSVTDPAKLKETFNKDSESDIGVGEKSAAIAGAVLSLGGLTDKLFGVGGDDISKSIYSFFSTDENKGKDTKSNDQSQNTKQTTKQNTERNTQQDQIQNTNQVAKRNTEQDTIQNTNQDLERNTGAKEKAVAAASATIAPTASVDVTSASMSKYVEDIEQIESVNKINEKAAKNSERKTTGEVKSSVITNSDPEIVKLLKSIDRKLDDKSKPAPFPYRFGGSPAPSNRSGGGVPSDFSNDNQRQQANNLG